MKDLTDEQIELAVQREWDRIGSKQKERLAQPALEAIVLKAFSGLDSVLRTPFSESELDEFSHFGVDTELDYWVEEIGGLDGQFDQVTGKFHSSPNNITEIFEKYKLNLKDYRRDDCELLYQELKRMEFDAAWKFYRKYRDWENDLHSPSSLIIDKLQAASTVPSIKFSELYAQFVAFKIKAVELSTDMQESYKRHTETILDLWGDVPVAEIKKTALKDLILTKVRYLPTNFRCVQGQKSI